METIQVEKKTSSLREFTRLTIAFFFCLVALTMYQYTYLYFTGVVDSILGLSFALALVSHIGFSALVGLVLVGLFHFLEHYKPTVGFKVIYTLLLILLSVEAILIIYYTTILVPLGAEIYDDSLADILQKLAQTKGIFFSFVPITAVLIVLFVYAYRFTQKFYHHINKMFPLTFIFLTLFVVTIFTEGKPINQNKTKYLATNFFTNFTAHNDYDPEMEYPLLQAANNEDVLGSYFNLKEQKPTLVFIIVDGLGKDFVGEGANYQGFTPFLDQLSEKSLSWENFLSTTGEDFGVIPSLLGSLPFGNSGFMSLKEYPNKLSLLSILKNNGYQTSFYQGGNSSLDNLDNFLKSEKIDFVLDEANFGKNYHKQALNKGKSAWAYPDRELFAKALSFVRKEHQPRLEVYKTLLNTNAFLSDKENIYLKQVNALLAKNKFGEKQATIIKKNKNSFAALLYTDGALQYFMDAYRELPNYHNTIFIITGNHQLLSIPQETKLSSFRVPFIIYSPMLKNSEKLKAVSSHFDVAPSINALLSKNYKLKSPSLAAWLGDGIDMHATFRAKKKIPLMRAKKELNEYVSNGFFLSEGDLFTIDEQMNLTKSTHKTKAQIEEHFKKFKGLNAYATRENKIIPDSLAIYKIAKNNFTKEEVVWINSQFNGKDYDKAYQTARQLAFDHDLERSLVLIDYILSEVPSHIDTKILKGRVNAWNGHYEIAIQVLEDCLATNGSYEDIYSALLDVYFWSGKNEKVVQLRAKIQENNIDSSELQSKLNRAHQELNKKSRTNNTGSNSISKIEAY